MSKLPLILMIVGSSLTLLGALSKSVDIDDSEAFKTCRAIQKQYPEADVRFTMASSPFDLDISYGCSYKLED